jgi:hypothetical protein
VSDSHCRFVLPNAPSQSVVLSRKILVFGMGNDPDD